MSSRKKAPVRIGQLCDEDKRKIATMIEQLALMTTENERLEEAAKTAQEREARTWSTKVMQLEHAATEQTQKYNELRDSYDELQTKYNRSLLLLRSYQNQVMKLSSDQKPRESPAQLIGAAVNKGGDTDVTSTEPAIATTTTTQDENAVSTDDTAAPGNDSGSHSTERGPQVIAAIPGQAASSGESQVDEEPQNETSEPARAEKTDVERTSVADSPAEPQTVASSVKNASAPASGGCTTVTSSEGAVELKPSIPTPSDQVVVAKTESVETAAPVDVSAVGGKVMHDSSTSTESTTTQTLCRESATQTEEETVVLLKPTKYSSKRQHSHHGTLSQDGLGKLKRRVRDREHLPVTFSSRYYEPLSEDEDGEWPIAARHNRNRSNRPPLFQQHLQRQQWQHQHQPPLGRQHGEHQHRTQAERPRMPLARRMHESRPQPQYSAPHRPHRVQQDSSSLMSLFDLVESLEREDAENLRAPQVNAVRNFRPKIGAVGRSPTSRSPQDGPDLEFERESDEDKGIMSLSDSDSDMDSIDDERVEHSLELHDNSGHGSFGADFDDEEAAFLIGEDTPTRVIRKYLPHLHNHAQRTVR